MWPYRTRTAIDADNVAGGVLIWRPIFSMLVLDRLPIGGAHERTDRRTLALSATVFGTVTMFWTA